MSVQRGPEGLRHFSKSQLIRVVEVATLKQYAAEQALAQRCSWRFLALAIVLAFAAGGASVWWVLG